MGYDPVAEKVEALGARKSLHFEPGFEDLLSNASHILFGQEGLIELSGKDDPGAGLEAVAGMSDAWLGVTLGEDGSCTGFIASVFGNVPYKRPVDLHLRDR